MELTGEFKLFQIVEADGKYYEVIEMDDDNLVLQELSPERVKELKWLEQ